MDTLDAKIMAQSGRLQLIVAAMMQLAQAMEHYDDADYDERLQEAQDQLMSLAGQFGVRWLNACADLLKNMYNRKGGA